MGDYYEKEHFVTPLAWHNQNEHNSVVSPARSKDGMELVVGPSGLFYSQSIHTFIET